jgi:hydroxymethylpyrimidine pyrophosphatase-like HAD family hydrolase
MTSPARARYRVLAVDFDGTIATAGRVAPQTLAALERLRASGRALFLVTGRELEDLSSIFPQLPVFDRVVAENGALVFDPRSGALRTLASPPPASFCETLRALDVSPLFVGRVIVATWEPHEVTVIETIKKLGLELEVIFNKGNVMVLPTGVNKGTGLRAALAEVQVPESAVVSVGDAENDHSFLARSGLAVAVANAIPSLKECADVVTGAPAGDGVIEIIEELIASDLSERRSRRRADGEHR